MDELLKKIEEDLRGRERQMIKDRLDNMKNPEPKKPLIYRDDYKTNLQWIRKMRDITQLELSELSGVSLRTLQDYEQGQKNINNAKAITVYKIAQVLECTVEDLLE